MTPTLSLQFNPSVPQVAGVEALAQVAAGADFLQALQQWLAQLQQQPAVVPVAEPQAPGVGRPAVPQGPALLASLLSVRRQGGRENGSGPGEEGAPLAPETAQDALALLQEWLQAAGDTPAPGIGEAVSLAARPVAGGGEELPPGESLPPDALATLSALSRQLEHWLQRTGSEAAGQEEQAENVEDIPEIRQAVAEAQAAAEAVPAGGIPVVPVPAENAPVGEGTASAPGRSFAPAPAAALLRKAESDALQGQAHEKAASPRAVPASEVPLAGLRADEAAPRSATTAAAVPAASGTAVRAAAAAAPAASHTAVSAAPAVVPPAPVSQAFSSLVDERMPPAAPPGAEAPPALPDAASPVAAQAVASNPPTPGQERAAPPPVATPVGHPGWDTEMSQRVVWMSGNSVSSAEIHLNPPHLGPVEVRISVNQDQQTSVQFLSPHAAVREALEAALPRLRDQFGAQQLTLGDVSVSQQSAGQQNDSQQARGFQFQQQQQSLPWRDAQPEFSVTDGAVLPEDGERMRPVKVGQGLLNLYV